MMARHPSDDWKFHGVVSQMKFRRRLSYLQWLASSEGPRQAAFLKRFRPSPLVLRALQFRHAFSKRIPRCREADVLFLIPTHVVKARIIRRHAEIYRLSTLVETGTHRGDMIAAMAGTFARCITIELSPELWQQAKSRLERLNGVTCLHGDSSAMLPGIAAELDGAALFWLDAHASGGNTANPERDPILGELSAIYSRENPGDVILIDDARGHSINLISCSVPRSHRMTVRNDIIRITPT